MTGVGTAVGAGAEQARPEGASRSWLQRRYGASWWHLATVLACLVATAYVVSRVASSPALFRIVVWFLGVAVVWDLVLGPALALADRVLRAVTPRLRGVSPLNFVRVPALVSLLLLLLWAPLVLRRSEAVYESKTGLPVEPFLYRWLGVTAVLFAVSGALLAVAVLRRRRDPEGRRSSSSTAVDKPVGRS